MVDFSDRIRSMVSHLKKENKVKVVYVDISFLEGTETILNSECLDRILHGKYFKDTSCVIPSDLLSCDLAFYWFRQMFKLVYFSKIILKQCFYFKGAGGGILGRFTKNFFQNGKILFLAKVIAFSNRENTYNYIVCCARTLIRITQKSTLKSI